MSTNNVVDVEAEAADMCCASCGIAAVDNINLMDCDSCDLVRYCSDKCQQEHRPQHGEICKERAAELRDEILFRQPESTHLGDCPICCLPLPIEMNGSSWYTCCSTMVCDGCAYANRLRQLRQRLPSVCPFCRHPVRTTDEDHKNDLKRAAANDPAALYNIGSKHHDEGDYEVAFEYWTKSAEFGNVIAHYELSGLYHKGNGVEKDLEKEIYHLEEAAIAGDPRARFRLGYIEVRGERFDRAVKHLIIAANLGHDNSIQMLKSCYTSGAASKEDFAAALRAHHAAVEAMKSPQRELASKTRNEYEAKTRNVGI
eukprot:scaffold9984_cov148-Skeletonema_dohrnii-CCMP3373.AAC.3